MSNMIQLNLNMKMPDKCSECKFFRVHNQMYCTAVVGYTTVSKPRDRKPAWCPLHEVTDTDTISRQQAIDEVSNNSPELAKENGELISRKAAIEVIEDELDKIDHVPQWVFDKLTNRLRELSSAQPELIRCKDCKYSDTDNTLGVMFCWRVSYHEASEDGFCSWAERRTDDLQ